MRAALIRTGRATWTVILLPGEMADHLAGAPMAMRCASVAAAKKSESTRKSSILAGRCEKCVVGNWDVMGYVGPSMAL